MLRHSAGYALAGRGIDTRTLQAFMGHRSIANTVIYTAVADKRIRHLGLAFLPCGKFGHRPVARMAQGADSRLRTAPGTAIARAVRSAAMRLKW